MTEITIAANDRRIQYTASGGQTVFPYDFPIFDDGEIAVYRTRSGATTLLTFSTDYTVSGAGAEAGGDVTLTAGATASDIITIVGAMPNARTTDFQEGGDFLAATINRELDRLQIQVQELRNRLDRTVRLEVFDDPQSFDALPVKSARALKYAAFDASGQLVPTAGTTSLAVITTFAETLLDDVSAIAMRATLGLVLASQAEIDAGTAARVVEADGLLASPGYGRGFRNAAARNGGLEVWQRGAGGAASISVAASVTAYTADGWALKTNANQASVVDQVAGIVTGSRWAARVRRNSGQTGTGVMSFEFPLDTDEIVALRGSKVTLSLTLQAGANWSPASGNLTIELRSGTGTPAKRSAGAYTGEAADISATQAITTTPTRYAFTSAAALGAAVTQGSIYLTWTPAGTAGAADDFTIDDVQVEIGTGRTAFERLPFTLELLLCQRHFWKTFKYDVAPAQNAGSPTADHQWGAQRAAAASNFGFLAFPVVMRAAPTITFFNPGAANAQARDLDAAADCSSTSGSGTVRGMRFTTVGNASTAIGNTLAFHATADAGI